MLPLLFVTLAALMWMVATAWHRHRDPLHPAIFLGPLLGYSYVAEPLLLSDVVAEWFHSTNDVLMVLALNCFCIIALAAGMSFRRRSSRQPLVAKHSFHTAILLQIAFILSAAGALGFAWGIVNVGGFAEAYSRHKGGGRYSSGYVGEAINLGLIAAMLVGVARWRKGLMPHHVALVFLGILPNLIQGTFGGRRGPLFLSLGAGLLVSIVSARKRPRVSTMMAGVAIICCIVLVMWSQRQTLHLGSESFSFDWDRLWKFAKAEDVDQGNNFIYGTGLVTTTSHVGEYSYGKKFLVNVLIRPIPGFLWPNKYRDVGADWITTTNPGFAGFRSREWVAAVGWVPLSGSSAGSISDVFGEFGWFTIALFFALGRGFAVVYDRHIKYGGLWTALMLESTVLSIYLATQSFSAFYHRFLLLAVPTVLAWHLFVKRRRQVGLVPAPLPSLPHHGSGPAT